MKKRTIQTKTNTEMVTIPRAKLRRLVVAQRRYEAMRMAGVHNWNHYAQANLNFEAEYGLLEGNRQVDAEIEQLQKPD